MGLMGPIRACYLGLYGIVSGLTKSTGYPSVGQEPYPQAFHIFKLSTQSPKSQALNPYILPAKPGACNSGPLSRE